MTTPLMKSELAGVKLAGRGKVRDVYEVGDALLIISTDRISAFDHVLPNGIADKGKVLNQISLFWFEMMSGFVRHHVREHDVDRFPAALRPYADVLRGRSVLVERLDMLPVECVVRGYLSGSGYKEYMKTGAICGIKLPAGLRDSDRLPEAIFTPSTKATTGPDENIPFDEGTRPVGRGTAEAGGDLRPKIYAPARRPPPGRGTI